MSEKTAEEKLRQALEGSTTSSTSSEPPKTQKKPKPSRARPKAASSSRTVKSESIGERLDSFMDDFERRIEQSINAVKSPSESHETSRRARISAEHKPETSRRVHKAVSTHPEPLEELIPSKPESLPKIDTVQEDSPVSQPETVPEISQPETVPEEIIPDVMPLDEAEPNEEELPDIPVIEAAFDEVPETPQDTYGDLPDIPVISADDEGDDTAEIFADGLEDIIPPDENEADEPRKESPVEFQEAELIEAPEIDDDFADIDADTDDFTDEPLDEEPAAPDAEEETEDAPPYDIESDDAGIFADDVDDADDVADDTPGDFSPSADVVLNVDDEIPQISQPSEPVNDPEAESVPVTVTMPESTKTAEDKLMADIAEAMTGNPLSLESLESPAYNIPENFFTEGANNGDSPQSAEDKLKANIAQALSESPINAAHEQARQSLEQDINPFEELSITEPEIEPHDEELLPEEPLDTEESLTEESLDDEEPLTEESHDGEESLTEETNDDGDFTPQETNDDVDELMPDSPAITENEDDTDGLNDPFTIPDFPDDDTESEPSMNLESSEDETRFFTEAFTDDDAEEETEPESDLDLMPKIEPEPETLQDIFTQPQEESEPEIDTEETPEPEPESESAANDDDDMPFPVEETEKTAEEPQKTPLTEQEALIAMLNQEFEPESNNFTAQEEAQPDNNMPEQSLLNDETPGTFEPEENYDDFDISSLGDELGQAATFADESEDFTAAPATVTEMITQPEAGITHNPEDDHKEKTMNIREKLASRKNGNSESAPAGKSKSGLLLTVLTGLLAVIGGLILWQLMQVSDKITSLAMNAPGYESSARSETPSYDYAIDFILDPNLADRMAQRGRAGWQVVGSRRTQDSTTGQYGYEFIFMRCTPGR